MGSWASRAELADGCAAWAGPDLLAVVRQKDSVQDLGSLSVTLSMVIIASVLRVRTRSHEPVVVYL